MVHGFAMHPLPTPTSYSLDPMRYSLLEAKLRPEHAHLYPFLQSSIWEPANVTAERVLARVLQDPLAAPVPWHQVLDPVHFELRRCDRHSDY